MFKSFKYRIYPNQSQELFIKKHIDAARFVYNWGLALRIKTYQNTGKSVSFKQTSAKLTKLKQQDGYDWLAEANSQSIQTSLKNLDKAYTAFFKYNKGFPKFKNKKKAKQCFSITQGIKLYPEVHKLFIPKLENGINIKLDRIPEGRIIGATITKTRSGKYFVAIKTEATDQLPKPLAININTAVGIDLGLTTLATLSNGIKIPNLKPLKKSAHQLKKLNRQLSKKTKGSNKREKARVKIAKLNEKITNQRIDYLHKITSQLANDNQVQTYCLETLNIEGMKANHKLAGSISDTSWAEFVRQLEYKCERVGKNILYIGQFEPSSKMCSCGKVNKELTLNDRIWTCSFCHTTHDRDVLAANNIKHFAFNSQNLLHLSNKDIVGSDRSELTPVENEKVSFAKTGSQ